MERFEDAARRWDPTSVPSDAIPAATAVLLRDHPDGMQVLMLRRNTKLAFVGGAWVFPGGRVDLGDVNHSVETKPGDSAPFSIEAARAAARRETMEEAGLDLAETGLVPLSHWMPPAGTPRRFSTFFFVAAAPQGAIRIDGGEIHDHMWTTPEVALQRRDAGEVQLAPPTFVTLTSLKRFTSIGDALPVLTAEPVEYFETSIFDDDGVLTALWHGDEFYPNPDGAVVGDGAGPRHRLRMAADRWDYVRHS